MRLSLFTASCLRCRRGAAALEFAIIAPIMLLLLVGIIEFGLIAAASVVLQGAVGTASRLGKTGYVPAGLTASQYLSNEVSRLSAGMLDPAKLTISIQWYQNLGQVGVGPGNPGPGPAGAAALYKVSYPWPLQGLIASVVHKSNLTISAVAVVQNEPQ